VQRFDSAAQLNIHFHALVADGVSMEQRDGTMRFHALVAPHKGDTLSVAWETCARTVALLRKQGRWLDAEAGELPEDDRLVQDNPLLAQCYAASLAGTLLFASGRRPMRLFGAPAREVKVKNGYGFDVDAAVRVPADERQRLERLCQYVLRPPFANDRLRALGDNRYELRLKRPWADGTTAIVLDGSELVALPSMCRSVRAAVRRACSVLRSSRSRASSAPSLASVGLETGPPAPPAGSSSVPPRELAVDGMNEAWPDDWS
jgi:hypothetical protein